MADIGQRGGTATVTASTTPTGYTIQLTSSEGWLKVYQNNQAIAIASADTNPNAEDRTAILTAVTTTTPDSAYNPTSVSDTRTFTVTQEGTGSTPGGQTIFFSTRGVLSNQSDEPRGRVDIWVNVESSEDDNALTWQPYSTSETNVEDLDIDYSTGYVTVSLQVGVEVPPYMAEYTVDVSCNGVTGHGQGGVSVPAFVQIQVPVSVTEGFAGYIDFTVFVRDS
jgi:hypothetical protein